MANLIMPLQIERQYSASLDANYEFGTLDELKDYATASALSYPGQILYCKTDDALYKVNATKTDVDPVGEGGGGANEVVHTSLTGNLDGITTTLDLVNALVTEYRSLTKPIRFVSGSITNTTLTDLPATYGVLTITVAGYDIVEVTFAVSNYGFKKMYYGYVNRTSSEALFSSITWEEVGGGSKTYTTLAQLGLTADATINDVKNALKEGESCIIRTDTFTDLTQFKNIQYGYLKMTSTVNGLCEIWLNDITAFGNRLYYGRQASGQFAEWIAVSTQKTYTTLAELGLTADATIDDVVTALPDGGTAMITTSEFTNYLTMFPNLCENDKHAILQVEKENGNRAFIEWRQKGGGAYAIGGLSSSNKFTNWVNIVRFKDDGYADDSIVGIGDTVSSNGTIQTLESLGFTTDIMTWDTGVYRVSHVSGLTNLPSDITTANPTFRLEHHDIKKWGSNHNPNRSTWAQRHSVLYSENGNIYNRVTASGATAGTYITDTGWQKIAHQNEGPIVTFSNPTQLGLPATTSTLEILKAMRALGKANVGTSYMGIFPNRDKTITDCPIAFGTLTVQLTNNDGFSIRYEGVDSYDYAGSWIGKWIADTNDIESISWVKIATEDNVVTPSGSQALTNKTYNGYTLGAACAKGVATTVASGNTNLVTSGAVYSAMPKYSLSGTTLTITTT